MQTSWNWPGSHWWRVDLHAHSPKSYDFGSQSDRENADWTRWLTAACDAGIQAVAITDHNTAEAIDHLKDAGSKVEVAPVLFPGVELTASDGIHLLLLMDPDCEGQHISDLLSTVKVSVDQRGKRAARSTKSVEQILDSFGDEVSIIGAHVNRRDGLLGLTGEQRIAVLRHPRLAAVEVDPSEPLDESWIDGSRPEIGRRISQVHFSDSHGFDKSGKRFTWMKMTRPNLEGLRLALLDGTASLRPASQDQPDDPNGHANLVIESITVCDGKFMGRSSAMTVAFNPWMNAIIGGRGTGKSTLVDFCRQTLRRESELDASESDEEGSLRSLFDRRLRVPADRGSGGLLTPQTRIELVYRKNDDRFVLSWSQDGEAQPIALLKGDERLPQEGNVSERFPVRIYSQKQLFALAQDPNALLSVIDDSRVVRKVELARAMDRLEARYLSLRAEARSASRQADELPTRRASLEDVQRKLDVLQESGHAEVLNAYRMLRQQDDTWREVLRGASDAVDSVARAASELLVGELDLPSEVASVPETASLRRAHVALQRSVGDLRLGVVDGVQNTRQDIESIRTADDAIQWRAAVDASESNFREASTRLAAEGIADPIEYADLMQQAARLRREIEVLENERLRAGQLERDSENALREYRGRREDLSKRRHDFSHGISGESIAIQVGSLEQSGNLASELRDILGTERFENDRQAIAQRIRPQASEPWDWERLDAMVCQLRKSRSDEEDPWVARDARFNTHLQGVPPERIDRLALYLPEDSVAVRFRDHQEQEWRSLAQGSPGQQTAALLAFVLGYGTEPIILDQPEDDLDNTLIYELLVKRLRETKLNRQVIVVTHNPNIVVHGDAELVLSLEAAAGQSHIACRGGLQERSVRDEICRVMEGGREAFESRYQRIMPATESGP